MAQQLSMIPVHGENPIIFNKKINIGRAEHSLNPHPHTSDNISFLPYPSPLPLLPLKVDVICVSPLFCFYSFFKCDVYFIIFAAFNFRGTVEELWELAISKIGTVLSTQCVSTFFCFLVGTVFKSLWDTYDGAFFENNPRLLAVDCFRKGFHYRFLAGYWLLLCKVLSVCLKKKDCNKRFLLKLFNVRVCLLVEGKMKVRLNIADRAQLNSK